MKNPSRLSGWRNWAALALFLLGIAQVAGYLVGNKPLRGFAAATAASPFPKVFCDLDRIEPFASDFYLNWTNRSGDPIETKLTPELYQHLSGPYNRRNVYGAALSYAPRLPDEIWRSVFNYGLGPNGSLRKEFGLPEYREITLRIETRTRGRNDVWLLAPDKR
jgi:hypothetical protein